MSSVSGKEVKGILDLFKVQKDVDEKKDLYASLENAKKEWEEAKNIFENVSEPDLVDYAIYNIEAAEKKYVYLLRKIKSEGSNEGTSESTN
ncbi:YaaL family protein [Sedimentibacter sp.]|uniref:YaaL family protein n=1 Tax=Sedimentibacter sp. TaxID=1960295 RepID=UPI0028A06218|nr:YaaL family protein [Sedimentibacter sp.]